MPDINPTPDVDCKYGAPMGRRSRGWLAIETRIGLRRVRLDSGGYDSGGAYWGCGAPLWYAYDEDGNDMFFRAASREAAKAHLRAAFEIEGEPPMRFLR